MVKYKITTKFISLIIPLALIMLVSTCGNDNGVGPEASVPTTLNISLAPGQEPVPGVKIDRVIVLVKFIDTTETEEMEEPIEQELTIDGAYATGLLKVPPGEVVFKVEAFAGEQLIYQGFEEAVIEAGKKVAVDIKLHRVDEIPERPEPELPDLTEMVLIPAGEFSMGDHHGDLHDGCRPVHTVYLDEFYIDKYEVTVGQYKKFIEATGHRAPNWDSVSQYSPTDQHPIISVSWHDAAAYAQWAGKRLPTEAQWEKAARGGLVGKKYPWGDEIITHDDANYSGTGGKDKWDRSTAPVGSFPPNGYDLYDMAGNVYEWCADEYSGNYYGNSPEDNPTGPGEPVLFVNDDLTSVTTPRVVRGGSWYFYNYHLRCAYRNNVGPTYSYYIFGFRCRSR